MDAMMMEVAMEPATPDRSIAAVIRASLPGLAVALLAGAACFAAAGGTLGLFLGCALLAVIVAAPLLAPARGWFDPLCIAGGIVDGIALIWLIAAIRSDITFRQWLECYVLLAAVVMALWGLIMALRRLTRSVHAAGALALLLMLLWMTWPVWLSPWLAQSPRADRAVALLAPAHPMLALNGLLIELGVWGEQRMAYQLTVLGQDVSYSLPGRLWPAVVLHLLIGGALLLLSSSRRIGDGQMRLAVDEDDRA
jgi:hypothetical protein